MKGARSIVTVGSKYELQQTKRERDECLKSARIWSVRALNAEDQVLVLNAALEKLRVMLQSELATTAEMTGLLSQAYDALAGNGLTPRYAARLADDINNALSKLG